MAEKHGYGAVPSPVDVRDYKIVAPQSKVARANDYPETFAISDMPEVLNQGAVGSCVAHAIATIMAWHYARQTSHKEKMSILGIYGNRRNSTYKDSGMIVRDALLAVKTYGSPLYDLMPGNYEVPRAIEIFEANYGDVEEDALEHIFTGVARVDSENAIKYALMNYGPVLFVIPCYKDLKCKNGILDSATRKNVDGAHCMIIYGWTVINDKCYWLIQNSWGTNWGLHGRAFLPMDFPLSESWEILDDHIDGVDEIVRPYNSKFGQIWAKILNAIINFYDNIKSKFRT